MYGYITDGSVIERVTQKLQRISEEPQPDVDDSMGRKERRTKTIAHELSQSGAVGFSLTEFDNAIKAAQRNRCERLHPEAVSTQSAR